MRDGLLPLGKLPRPSVKVLIFSVPTKGVTERGQETFLPSQ